MVNLADALSSSKSVIKSIQKGALSGSGAEFTTISAVNVSKSIIIINGWAQDQTNGGGFSGLRGGIDTSTTIRIQSAGGSIPFNADWQVVEFY